MAATVLTTLAQVQQLVQVYLSRPTEPVFFDIETTGLNPRRNQIAAIQLKQGTRGTVIIDVRATSPRKLIPALAPIFEQLRIVGHNIKFDLGFLRPFGIRAGKVFDTQIAEQLIRGVGLSEAKNRGFGVNLEATAERYGQPVSKEEREWFYKPAPLDERPEWFEPFPPEQIDYMSQDVDVLGPIMSAQAKRLRQSDLLEVTGIEMRALLALVEMEYAGIRIDVAGWREFIAEKETEAKRLEEEALAIIGAAILADRIERYDKEMERYRAYRTQIEEQERLARAAWDAVSEKSTPGWGEFKQNWMAMWRAEHEAVAKPKLDTSPPDIGSTTQLIVGLERLGVPVPTKKNDKGVMVKTTESDSLEPLADDYPVVGLLLGWRKQSKFVTSFGEALLQYVEPGTSRIHSDYMQIGAGTGRMSCTRPNFQQIPSKGDGKRVRALVQAQPDWVLLTADFSNIELRILANISGEPAMIAAFAAGLDLHSETARRMFSLPDDVDPKTTIWKRDLTYRQIAKIINFMLVYGGSPFKLAKEIGIEVDEAERLVAAYFAAYPRVKQWMDETKAKGLKELKARTLSGRIRLFDSPGPEPVRNGLDGYGHYMEQLRDWRKARARIERQSLNTPIQGTSADITKLAQALFNERVDGNLARAVAVVHDEIVVEAHKNYAKRAEMVLAQAMKDACDVYLTVSPVPMPEVNISDHWEKD